MLEQMEKRELLSGPSLLSSSFYGVGTDNLQGSGIAIANGNVFLAGTDASQSQAVLLQYGLPPGSSPTSTASLSSSTSFSGLTTISTSVVAVGSVTPPAYGSVDNVGGIEQKTFRTEWNTSPLTLASYGSGPVQTSGSTAFFSYSGGESLLAVTAANEAGSPFYYVTGYAQANGANNTAILAKYDASGTLVWFQILGNTGSFDNSSGSGITTLNGNIYVAGGTHYNYNDPTTQYPALWESGSSGNLISSFQDTSLNGSFQGITAFGGNIYAVGTASNSSEFLIEKFDASGNLIWRTAPSATGTHVLSGVVGLGNQLYAVGYVTVFGVNQAVLLQIDPGTGTIVSQNFFGGSLNTEANGIATDGTDLYVVGESRSFSPAGQAQMMLLRYGVVQFGLNLSSALVTAGNSLQVTVSALNPSNAVVTGYRGTVQLTSSDFQAILPADYTFTAADNGVHTFTVTLKTAGSQTLTATDTATSTITGATGNISEFPVPTANGQPFGITAGPDGNLWFAEYLGNKIGRITPQGAITEFTIPTANSQSNGITAGPDGNVWFVEGAANKIGRITPNGTITEFTIPTANSGPRDITAGPDQNLWFTENYARQIGRITPSGAITEYVIPSSSQPNLITVGPDGNLWFTESFSSLIGRSTTGGVITEFSAPTSTGFAGITTGPDGNLWLAGQNDNDVVRRNADGTYTLFPVTPANSAPFGITAGPDGNLWFTQNGANQVSRISTSGQQVAFPIPTGNSGPNIIVRGPDGNLWFAEYPGNQIGRLTPPVTVDPASASQFVVSAPANTPPGTAFSFTVTAEDPFGNIVTNYTGTVHFTSPDSFATLPADYTFTSADGGVHSFSASLQTHGSQTITATDTVNSAITGSATILVAFMVTNTNDSGAGSLRQAILDANAHPGLDLIDFDIAAGGVQTIMPLSALPTITDPVIIDGTSEPGFAGTPIIKLDGTSAGASANGLDLISNGNTIQGLAIDNFGNEGILVDASSGNLIAGNYIGVDTDGKTARGNLGTGIFIRAGAQNNIIGGTTAAARNVISGNIGEGIEINDINGQNTSGNIVEGNYIGTDATGTMAVGNHNSGVFIAWGVNNTIGDTAPGAGNVISGNLGFAGIAICGAGYCGGMFDNGGADASGNVVEGNLIGSNAAGNAALGNLGFGISVDGVGSRGGSGDLIGGTAAGAGNVISANGRNGIAIFDFTVRTTVQGNFIGTDITGTIAMGNSANGILIESTTSNNTIGGSATGARNVISGNLGDGVQVGVNSAGNVISGNYIGTNVAGTAPLGNAGWGVSFQNSSANTVSSNVISGNTLGGVNMTGNGALPGTVSWWKADGNAIDSVGNNNGTLNGGVSFAAGVTGRAGDQAFNFDGSNSAISIPASSSLNVGAGAGFSFDAWINPTTIDSTPRLIVEYSNGTHLAVSGIYGNAGGPGSLFANLVDTNVLCHAFD
jgi:streptogramin lyase